ncbi:MAG: Stealth CR1 domain-containing protein [Arachnia sp.]
MRAFDAAHLTLRAVEAAGEAAGHAWTRLRDRGAATDTTVWTRLGGHSLVATPVDAFVGSDAIAATLAEVTTALTAAGVAHEVSATEPPTVAVPPAAWSAAVAALAPLRLYVRRGRSLSWLAVGPTPGAPLRVFRAWASRGGDFVAGPDVGIDLVAGPAPAPAPPPGDIDVVFTWVDGADPEWRARKQRRLHELGMVPRHQTAANEARFTQASELRYALRALARFAPWVRRVFVVTEGHRPPWLAEEYPSAVVVRHDEIFADPTALPTFNSHAIESRLHHIPGLAERYLYLNDDFFLGRYLHPSEFFTADGKARVFLANDRIPAGTPSADDEPVVAAARNNDAVLRALTGTRVTRKLKHAPYAQLRSVAVELEERAAEQFAETARSSFRSPTDLSVTSSLLPYYALATGRAVEAQISHFYADVAAPELAWRLPHLLEHRDADVICLNATSAVPADITARIKTWGDRYFPPLG